jgi:spore maturation protein SpmB
VAEAFGVGNIGVAASIAMAVVSIGIEIAVDHYNKNPMPAEIAQKLRRGSALAALGGAITAPISGGGGLPLTAAIVKIYGAETLAKELKAMGTEGFEALKQLAGMGKEGAAAALAVFKELALEGGALGLRALDELQKMGKAGAEALADIIMAGGTQAKWALEKLRNMGSLGQEALKAMMQELWNQGEKGLEVLVELYNQSGLNELQAFVMEKLQTAWDNSSLSNGYAGIRTLASEMLAQAEKSGDAATAFVKEMLQIFDQTYAGGMVPDALYR